MRLLVKLLSIPLQSLSIQVLSMNHYPELMKYMKFANRRTVALQIVKAVIKEKKQITSLETSQQLIDFIMPLLVSDATAEKEEPYEFEEGQNSVAKLIHQFSHPYNENIHYELLMKFKRMFVKGGPERMRYTLPALIFALFRLSREMVYRAQGEAIPCWTAAEGVVTGENGGEEESKGNDEPEMVLPKTDQHKIYKCVNELILQIQPQQPEIALRLYLQAAEAMNQVPDCSHMEELGYEFVSQALTIYQDELPDSETKQ